MSRPARRTIRGRAVWLSLALALQLHCGDIDDGSSDGEGGEAGEGGAGGSGASAGTTSSSCGGQPTLAIDWARLDERAPPPTGRAGFSVSASGTGLALFGGTSLAARALGETFLLEGDAWRPLTSAQGPPARTGQASTTVGDSAWIFGGLGAGLLSDTWLLRGETWQIHCETDCQAPSGRHGAAAAFDLERQVVVLFGGFDGAGPLGDTWEWSEGSGWRLACSGDDASVDDVGAGGEGGAPAEAKCGVPSRFGAAITYDPSRRRVLVQGGFDGATDLGDMWSWDGTRWRREAAPPFAERSGHSLVYDSGIEMVLAQGGYQAGVPLGVDVWGYDSETRLWLAAVALEPNPERPPHGVLALSGLGELLLVSDDPLAPEIETWRGTARRIPSVVRCECEQACGEACDTTEFCVERCLARGGFEVDHCRPLVGNGGSGGTMGTGGRNGNSGDTGRAGNDGGQVGGGAGGEGGSGGVQIAACGYLDACCDTLSGASRTACRAAVSTGEFDVCEAAFPRCESGGMDENRWCLELAACCPTLTPNLRRSCVTTVATGVDCVPVLEGGFCP